MNGFEKRTEQKKRQVLEAAFQLLNAEDGFDRVTMDDIARHAKVSKTSVFKYFGSKENLIREVFKYLMRQMIDEAQKIMSENRPFEETLAALTQNKIRHLEKINRRFYLELMEYITKKDDEGLSLIMREYNETNLNMMLDLFHRGRKEGKVDLKYSDEFLLVFFQAMVEGISSPHVYSKMQHYTALWTELVIKGLAPEKK
ncbi:MAG TPA: TetR/AcrR family transcriptional regulator [Paenibacillaceae bacterium]